MPDVAGAVTSTLGMLVRELDRAPPTELVGVCRAWLRRVADARECDLMLADYSETSLEPMPAATASARAHRQQVDNSAAGTAYRQQRVVHVDLPAQRGLTTPLVLSYVPVSIRTERLGVLAVTHPATHGSDTTAVLDHVAQILAYMLTGARRYTDQFEAQRRRRALGLAAEIQWELLPVLAYELPDFSIAGALEPAYDIGGDTFDYAVSARGLTVSITDAVGHGLRSALLSSLAVTAMRNMRRCGGAILDQATAANTHLVEQFPGPSFVTGLLLQVAVDTGHVTVINAGHPLPLLLRDHSVCSLIFAADRPMGLFADTRYRLHDLELLPGDRLLLLTDGISEAHHPGGPEFGLRRVADLLSTKAHLPPAEFVRLLTREVSDYRGEPLTDDATAVCLDWHSRNMAADH